MNIDRNTMKQILAGKVTQIRIPGTHEEAPAQYAAGRSITLRHKSRGQVIARIVPSEVRDQRLEDAAKEDAEREGLPSVEALIERWRPLVKHWTLSPELVVFRVVRFELNREEKPEYLAEQQGKAHPPQYTTSVVSALKDAGARVPKADQERFTAEAIAKNARLRADHEKRHELRRLKATINRTFAKAEKSGEDITDKLVHLRKQTEEIRDSLGEAA